MGKSALKRIAVFLDRDGVLNRNFISSDGVTHPPERPEQLELLPGVVEACARLRDAECLLVVVSNQPDVARGKQTREIVEAINFELSHRLPLDSVRVCYHDTPDRCECRKPAPGLLLRAAADLGIDLERSFMVGDRASDVEAGRRAGCRTVLVVDAQNGLVEPMPARDYDAPSLAAAADWICAELSRTPKTTTVGEGEP
jgi:D-glycero-D-manno-heptose 1,7-bisphosphate phosphatase